MAVKVYGQLYIGTTAPAEDPVQVGALWTDLTNNLLKRCTSTSPFTWVSTEGGSSAHDLFSATHGDVDEADTPTDGQVLKYNGAAGRWQAEDEAAASGEANTASNVGTAGVGVFKQKTGVDLEFKKLNAGSGKVSVSDDGVNSEVDLDVVEAQLSLANLGTRAHSNLTGVGADDHHARYTDAEATAQAKAVPKEKTIAVENPAADDNFGGIFFDDAVTITQVNHSKRGGTNVVYNIYHATTRNSGTPKALWTTDKTVTSESGEEFTTFDDATIPAGSYLWVKITSVSGSPTRFETSLEYARD